MIATQSLDLNRPVALLTRPAGRAEPMLSQLRSLGIAALNEPLLGMTPIAGSERRLDQADLLCVTSPFGASMLSRMTTVPRSLKVFAVGPATAEVLKRSGFADVEVGDGTGTGMVSRLMERSPCHSGKIVHVGGEHIAHDIASALVAAGFQAERAIVYRADKREKISSITRQMLDAGRIAAVVCMSKRTAETLTDLLRKYSLFEPMASAVGFAMSRAIADQLIEDGWTRVEIAREPSMPAMIELVRKEADLIR